MPFWPHLKAVVIAIMANLPDVAKGPTLSKFSANVYRFLLPLYGLRTHAKTTGTFLLLLPAVSKILSDVLSPGRYVTLTRPVLFWPVLLIKEYIFSYGCPHNRLSEKSFDGTAVGL